MKEVVWYPGEPICTRRPFIHWQKVQRRINRLKERGGEVNEDYYWTAELLNKMQNVRLGIKGRFNRKIYFKNPAKIN